MKKFTKVALASIIGFMALTSVSYAEHHTKKVANEKAKEAVEQNAEHSKKHDGK